jgi:hypothetical protein
MSQVQTSNDDLLLEAESTNTKLDTLNTNGAKEAKQDTMITSLQAIETNTAGSGLGDTGAASTVAVSVSSVTIIAANTARREVIIRNDTNNDLYLAHGATATTSNAVKLKKGDVYIEDKYVGVISGIWSSVAGGGNAQITEIDVA